MRKSSPRVLAGIVMLALFASVGLMSSRAFTVSGVEGNSAPQVVTAQTPTSSNWTETRGPTNYKP
jgi:hypothetical protein